MSYEDGRLWLVNDLVISEENCNMSCSYCLTDASEFKEKHLDHPLRKPPVVLSYDNLLKQQLDTVTDRMLEGFNISILKVSGGEVMLIQNMMEFLKNQSRKYERIQILTNGMNLTDDNLSEFTSWGNVVLQISIDHHTLEGNSHRLSSQKLQNKLLQNIDNVVEHGIPLELYCVLNDRSLSRLESFLEYLLAYRNKLMIMPFPVRGPLRHLFYPKQEDTEVIKSVIQSYDRYELILPPLPYMKRLLLFLEKGGRQFGCNLPRMVFSTFNDGSVTACPNIWFNDLGSVLKDDYKNVLHKVENTPFYELLVRDQPRLDACRACFTPWDLLNLYVDGEITIDELCKNPMYNHPIIRDTLLSLKNKITYVPLNIAR